MTRLKFFLRKQSPEEAILRLEYNPPTRESYELLCGYEPTKAPATYEDAVANYNRWYESGNCAEMLEIAKREGSITVEKVVVSDTSHDRIVREIEAKSDFIRWVP
jgi:hypothetical protein